MTMTYELTIQSVAMTSGGGIDSVESCITLFKNIFHFNPIMHNGGVKEIISNIFPTIDWQLACGTDTKNTNMCQYTCYASDDEEHCVAATFSLL